MHTYVQRSAHIILALAAILSFGLGSAHAQNASRTDNGVPKDFKFGQRPLGAVGMPHDGYWGAPSGGATMGVEKGRDPSSGYGRGLSRL